MSIEALLVLGCGFTGTAAAVSAFAAGRPVAATVRTEGTSLRSLRTMGVDVVVAPALTAALVEPMADGADVLVTFPPDGVTDDALAAVMKRARSVVYLSSTGVYGDRVGRIDEDTPTDAREPKAAARLRAEGAWRDAGATVLRAAGIYGPGRGLHRRLIEGSYRVPGDGSRVVSRVHVDDLAAMALGCLDRGLRGQCFVAADDAPVPQGEVVRALCAWMGLPPPASVALTDAPETLRHDRAVINARVKAVTGLTLRYPSWREGFAQCLTAEGVAFTR
ncbi:MAG: NAD-dependent epimerase/dehydratase family protein [Deltaproteobacteria bacterium]|nr:NAD-dependent epimerase/dehydratase family protein [Myxococcales bacterium]MDP3218739.1 NAD-dependent epimerase/dehydratase family protein [Deltaproteobacteria bacterium]